MDEVIDMGDITGQPGVAAVGDCEYENGRMNPSSHSTAQDDNGEAEPHLGLEFDSEDAAKEFYDGYARRLGFSSRLSQTSRSKSNASINARDFLCAKNGLKRCDGGSCNAMLRVESKGHDKLVVTKFVKEHNHSIIIPGKVNYLQPHRHSVGAAKKKGETHAGVGVVPSGVMYVSMDGNHVPTDVNRGARSSPIHATPKRTLGKDAQNLLDYFKKMQAVNPGFYYSIQLDEDNHMTNVFWADGRSRTAYSHFGDSITLDTMYRVNQHRVPFAPLTGANHHGQMILFGCALLFDESEASFIWLFKTFLAAMDERAPISIITDQDKAIQAAVAQVFPGARHCISKWHVLREGQERLAHVCYSQPKFQVELYNCINLTETVEEFESAWNFILDKYDLRRNDWLQSLYNARRQWVPAYFRDSFFASMCFNQGFEGSFFDGYVNQETTLPMFFRQYERALESSFEKEMEADFDTLSTTPALRTPSPMEKQAASLYTKKVFSKFQEELVETFVYTANQVDGNVSSSSFRVAKFEDDQKSFIVSFDVTEIKASCTCQMFEYSGILCRHILTVFTVTNVLTLPPHYILKRWTRNAKNTYASGEQAEVNTQESLASRYNNLCREAIKFAEEGAIASDTFNVAMTVLRDGAKKVALMKNNVVKVAPAGSKVSVVGHDDRRTSVSPVDMPPVLWPRSDELARQFNPNNGSVPAHSVSDLNHPNIGPVSLLRDDGQPSNMVILPCLKSMTWVMENKGSTPSNRVAVITLKLQDYTRMPTGEFEVKFHLSAITLEPMLRSMACINEQLSTPANRIAVINLKLQDTEATSGESEVKFQVSRDTLGAMLRSMAYIREQLSNSIEPSSENSSKRSRKK